LHSWDWEGKGLDWRFFSLYLFASCWLGIPSHSQQIVVNKKDGLGAYGTRDWLGKTLLNRMESINQSVNVEITKKFLHSEMF
jgi:hypothetical protein